VPALIACAADEYDANLDRIRDMTDRPQVAQLVCAVCRRPVSLLFRPGPRPFGWRCPYRDCERPVHNLSGFPGELVGTWTGHDEA
jgi:hypothetical protein